jgi:endonuclease/exonuclease/phosphatase family metal-dependent hydrolase
MSQIRILSTNLQNGGAAPVALARVLDEWQPDLVVAQELAADCAEVIATRYSHGLLKPAIDFSGVGLAAAHPITVTWVPLVHRAALSGMLDESDWHLDDGPLEIIGVHLTNPLQRPLSGARHSRSREAEVLLERGLPEHARVIIGDMNATPAWPLYRTLCGVGADAARASKSRRKTWAPQWWQPAMLRIDHAFVHRVEVIATHTARIRGTDHRALIVDVVRQADSGVV